MSDMTNAVAVPEDTTVTETDGTTVTYDNSGMPTSFVGTDNDTPQPPLAVLPQPPTTDGGGDGDSGTA